MMGNFKSVENMYDKGSIGTSLRFRVDIDVTKPLRHVIQLSGPDGQEFQVRLAYERLPNFCYYYGIIG